MKNDATLDGEKISVPPTLLFSLMGNHEDVRKAISSDFKNTGDAIYLVGETKQELGASELAYMLQEETEGVSGIGGNVPSIDPERNLSVYKALTKAMHAGLVASAHDCSDGGLSVAIAESCFGIDAGAKIDISYLDSFDDKLDSWGALFGESLGRIVVSINPKNIQAFEEIMTAVAHQNIGEVGNNDDLVIMKNDTKILTASITKLREAWKGTLDGGSAK